MSHRSIVLGALLLGSAALAAADDLPSGYGVVTTSGSTYTTSITPAGDVDFYAFQGFPGTKVTATVKATKAATPLAPVVTFVRPDGTVPDDDAGFVVTVKGLSTTATVVLDTPGWWQVRVAGKDGTSTGAYSVNVVLKPTPTRPTLPLAAKSFTTKGADIATKTDTDDWTFAAYSGQTVTATVTIPKKGTLFPGLKLYRPNGTEVTGGKAFDGKNASVATTATPNDNGIWRARVYGIDTSEKPDPKAPKNTTGPYTLAVKLGKTVAVPSLKPDENGQYRFLIPAVAGAKISYTLTFKGTAPTFNSFVDPSGVKVPSFTAEGVTKVASFVLPPNSPFGYYALTYDAPTPAPTNVTFASKVVAPASGKPVKGTLSASEPLILIGGVTPSSGGSQNPTTISVTTIGDLVDAATPDASRVAMFIDHSRVQNVSVVGSTITGTVQPGLAVGPHDVVVQSSGGQVAVAAAAFEVVPPPDPQTIDPSVGSVAGGYPIVITGEGFSKLGDPQICIDALTTIVPTHINYVTDTKIEFIAPNYGAAGKKTFGVVDNRNGNGKLLPLQSFEFVSSPAISRIVPSLTTILGGDLVTVNGANFQPTDHVYLEKTPLSGQYDLLSNTYVSSTMHQFTAPAKGPGPYNVYVTDQFGQPLPPRTRTLTYFQYADLAATLAGMFPSGTDLWDGATIAVGDFDNAHGDDIVISRIGGAAAASTPNTRILINDGTGKFADATASMMPVATTTDDWRADRVWVADVNSDGYPDIFIVSNDSTVISGGRSHTRILVNEPRTGSTPLDRVFRDRTNTIFPGPRGANYDNWRGLDMWVGDVDKGPPGPPEILITNKDLKQELDVTCSPYCASPGGAGYTYGFYWGGSRAFFWDKTANGGLGKYKFERNFFPRKSGLRVPVGMGIPICNSSYGSPCVGRFTPFLGKRIVAADLNADDKPDVAVVSDDVVQRIYPPSSTPTTISSLQVAINKFDSVNGIEITDVTDRLTAIGGDFRADAIAIGLLGYPDANSFGTIAISKAVPTSGLAMRLLKFKPGVAPNPLYDFEDITGAVLPNTGVDVWQASRIIFKDVDGDGDQDMIVVCNAPPGGSGPAFRILRNDIVNTQAGLLTTGLVPLLQSPYLPLSGNEHYEGDTMAIGDFTDDGVTDLDFVVARANTTAPSPETRIIITKK